MDKLLVSPEEVVVVPARNYKEIRVTQHMYDAVRALRDHLKKVARAGGTITYGEATEVTGGAYIPNGLGPALDVLSEDCFRRDEPSLASLVVRKDAGEVGHAFLGEAQRDREACYQYWSAK